MPDYRVFHALERYLFDKVGLRFRNTGRISPTDFFLIIVWKSNRSKSKMTARIKAISGTTVASAIRAITAAIYVAQDEREKLRILMEDWQFRLPIASAILTVLYPLEFTIYDVRVCGQLGNFDYLKGRAFSDALWADYEAYVAAVRAAAPPQFSLREADQYLWGKSLYQGVRASLR